MAPPTLPHVLFIASDDLRPTLGAYGTQALTPNVDGLAARGVVFDRAFAQFPWCSPSRQSYMSGRRPDATQAWNFLVSFRDTLPNSVSLSQHFREAGWHAVSSGKIYHGQNCVRGSAGCCALNETRCVQVPRDADYPLSWDEPPVDFGRRGCAMPSENASGASGRPGLKPGPPPRPQWCENDDEESMYADYGIADAAIARLRAHAANPRGKPLFLAVGFRDDHLPWAAPKRYRDLFDVRNVSATRRGGTPAFGEGSGLVPKVAWQWPSWVGRYFNLSAAAPLGDADLREALRSYMANIAWTDAQLGRVLRAFDDVGYTSRTLTVFFGDHGQNLGEHNTWAKMTAWEPSLRVPLIFSVPWMPAGHGKHHRGQAELLDLYKTLSELAGINASTIEPGVQGDSLAAAIAAPEMPGKPHSFSQTNRVSIATLKAKDFGPFVWLPPEADAYFDPSCNSAAADLEWMGYTLRSASWRYTEWYRWNGTRLRPIVPEGAVPAELYDHRKDDSVLELDEYEYENLAHEPQYAATVAQLRATLRHEVGSWTGALHPSRLAEIESRSGAAGSSRRPTLRRSVGCRHDAPPPP